jgi:hypothetical protein
MFRRISRPCVSTCLLAALLAVLAAPAVAQETLGGVPADFRSFGRQAEGLTPSFNGVTGPYKFLYSVGPIWIGIDATSPNCRSFDLAILNGGAEPQQFLAELWSQSGILLSSGNVALAGNAYRDSGSFWSPRSSIGSGCTTGRSGFTIKLYSTSNSLIPTAFVDFNTAFDTSYTVANNLIIPTGAFHRSVMTSSFSFGSSAGVCATTPENSIKVPASKAFPASPVFGDYGWQTSGGTNTDACSGSAYADFFIRSSANISGAGKWTFTYQVPNGLYDVSVIYNASPTPAGDTTITVNGQTVANAVVTPGGANVQQANVRLNVGGNQILVGALSNSGTAVLNGVIINPVAQ